MENTTEPDTFLLWLTPDQWTEINGLASSITAFAAVVGVILAWRAVRISRDGARLSKQSVDLARRESIEESFLSMMTAVRSYGAALYQWSEGVEVEDPRSARQRRDGLNRIYVQLQAVEQEVSQFRLGGLPAWDHHIRGGDGVLTLAASVAALEYMIVDRFDRAREALIVPAASEVPSTDLLLEEYVQGFFSRLMPGQREDDLLKSTLRRDFRFQQDQVWAEEMAQGVAVSRQEVSRQAFDHVLNLVSDTWAGFVERTAPWDPSVPAVSRPWT